MPSAHHIDVRELRDRLSRYLGEVDRGASLVITRRGRPIARLEPFADVDLVDEPMHLNWPTPGGRGNGSAP